MLAGVAPAVWSVRIDLVSALRSGGRGSVSAAGRRGRRALVVAQVALAVCIVAAAGLVTRSVLRLQSVDVGLAADRLLFVELSLPFSKYVDRGRRAHFLEDVLARLEAAPAIAAATAINVLPFSGDGGWDVPRFTAEGQSAERAAINPPLISSRCTTTISRPSRCRSCAGAPSRRPIGKAPWTSRSSART